MNWLTDKIIFYGGIALTALSCIAIVLFILVLKIKKSKILALMIKEYGEPIVPLKEKKKHV